MVQKYIEIVIALKYLSNFWRTLEMPLINWKITVDLNSSTKGVIVATNALVQQHVQ